jgi:hypothetical protein
MAKKKATEKTARDSTPKGPAISPAKAEEDVKFCVWIGPGVRGVIQYGQIFRVPRERAREVLPAKVAALWDDGANALVVGPEQLPAARLAVRKEGSALYKLARSITLKLTGKNT